ncbi:MAG: SPFH domain-containing protein [Spirochaetales bacterium]|nr:SPFH domain-containing protein [Spirochaetales bacterium]
MTEEVSKAAGNMTPRKIGIIVAGIIGFILLVLASSSIFTSVSAGEIHVKQAAISGDLSVRSDPGLYFQWFGQITKYEISTETYLSNDVLDGGRGAETDSTLVRFGDGGTADIGSVTKWRLPVDKDAMLKIHRDFRSFSSLRSQVRQWIIEVEKQTASSFKAEDTYSTRRGEFSQLISEQIINGLYATETVAVEEPSGDYDDDGNPMFVKTMKTEIKRDDLGNPLVVKQGIFQEYGITLVNHTLKDINFDETIDKLIAQKKEAEQQRAVARANAERARQDAITAEEQGKARIAQARADEEVKKITAVTQAEKDKEVAVLDAEKELQVAELGRQRAEEEAAALLAKERAQAEANRLKVQAGLTPQERANVEKDIAIGVAQ